MGDKDACFEVIEKESLKPANRSTDEIEVDLIVTRFDGHKSYNSKEIRKDNGKYVLGQHKKLRGPDQGAEQTP